MPSLLKRSWGPTSKTSNSLKIPGIWTFTTDGSASPRNTPTARTLILQRSMKIGTRHSLISSPLITVSSQQTTLVKALPAKAVQPPMSPSTRRSKRMIPPQASSSQSRTNPGIGFPIPRHGKFLGKGNTSLWNVIYSMPKAAWLVAGHRTWGILGVSVISHLACTSFHQKVLHAHRFGS